MSSTIGYLVFLVGKKTNLSGAKEIQGYIETFCKTYQNGTYWHFEEIFCEYGNKFYNEMPEVH